MRVLWTNLYDTFNPFIDNFIYGIHIIVEIDFKLLYIVRVWWYLEYLKKTYKIILLKKPKFWLVTG